MASRCAAALVVAVAALASLLLFVTWPPRAPQPPWQMAAAEGVKAVLQPANDAAPAPRILLAAGTLARCGRSSHGRSGEQASAMATLAVTCSFGLDSGRLFVSSAGLAAAPQHAARVPPQLALVGVDALTCTTALGAQQQPAPLFMFLLHRAAGNDAELLYSVVESAQAPDSTGACEALASRLGGWASHVQQQPRQQQDGASAAGSSAAATAAEQPSIATWRRQLLQAPGTAGNATANSTAINGTAGAGGINGTAAATQNGTSPTVTSAAGPPPGATGIADSGAAGAASSSAPPDASACLLPAEVGLCRAAIPRWAYDAAAMTCISFTYGGCGGNANQFASKEACEAVCAAAAPVQQQPTPLMVEPAAGIALTMLPDATAAAAGSGSSQAPAAAPTTSSAAAAARVAGGALALATAAALALLG